MSGNVLAGFSCLALLMQTAGDLTGMIGPVERLTLVGVLVVAVRVLWASNAKKDAQIADLTAEAIKTMALVLEAVKEMRREIEEEK